MIAHARTRLLHRRRRLRNLALACLLGVIAWYAGLALAASLLAGQQIQTAKLVEPLRIIEAPKPEPERVDELPPEQEPPPLVTPALPALELSSYGSGLALPDVPLPDMPRLRLPPVQLPGVVADSADAAPGAPGLMDHPPRILAAPALDRFYPARARRRGVEGSSSLELDIDAEGRVLESRVLRSRPPGVFDEAARRAAKQLRCEPCIRGGKAVAATLHITFDWTLR